MSRNMNLWYLRVGISMLTLTAAFQGATAQSQQPAQPLPQAEAAEDETSNDAVSSDGKTAADDLVVTGSRIVRDGYAAPTPVTVLAVAQLEAATPSNIPDAINKMPQFFNSRGQASALTNADRPFAGNYLDLRGVGPQRTLVLLDGRRVPPTSYEGSVDTNLLPQLLVQRVDVVTAGASAVYGSDAISGVINFVLDTKYQGIKAVAQSGISQRGDNGSYRLGLAGGTSFADGRGHIIFSAETYDSNGIPRKTDRAGQSANYLYLGSGTAADPFRIYANATFNNVARGGYVVNGPFARQQFITGGILAPFDRGTVIGTRGLSQGGDGAAATGKTVLVAGLTTYQTFARASYDFSDAVSVFAQASYADSRNQYDALENNFRFGIPIFSGNAFLPANAQAMLTATNTASFTMNRGHDRFEPLTIVDTRNKAFNATIGANGKFGGWSWEAFYTHGDSKLNTQRNESENSKFFAAIDAVDEGQFNGGARNGNIVCRVTLTNPGRYPGCLPLNLFGENSPSAAALANINGITKFNVHNKLDEFSGNVQGTLFDIWAGPVSASLGASYRKQSIAQVSNADPAVARDYTGIRGISPTAARFVYTNVGSASGSYDVKEAFGEIVIPIARDLPFIRNLELNGAGRYTKYSTTGGETTWKVGVNYSPIEALRFRGTISRDIRAPTLFDLFAGRFFNSTVFSDPRTSVTAVLPTFGGGNQSLKPEVGKTKTVGVIFQPGFLRGFSFSADWYELEIGNAISTLTALTISDRCEASGGTDPLCARISRPFGFDNRTPANFPTSIDISPVNLASIITRGVDFEASYNHGLGGGTLGLRGIVSYVYDYVTNSGLGAPPIDQAGLNLSISSAFPKVRGTFSVSYTGDMFNIFLQERYVGSTRVSNLTPAIFVPARAPSALYTDLTIGAKIPDFGGSLEPFLTINNLFDKKPPLVPAQINPGVSFPTTLSLYDVIGRSFTAGVRIKF